MTSRSSLQPNQTKSKGFSLPKCFQLSGLTKTLFPCKSAQHANHENYVIFNYENKSNNSDFSNSNPATSTMIYSTDYQSANINTLNSVKRYDISEITNHQNEYYVLQPDTDYQRNQFYRNQAFDELEETPRSNINSISSISSYNSYEDLTIVKHNNSPISDCKTYEIDDSTISTYDYFQSTKLSNDYTSKLQKSPDSPLNLSPLPTNKQSTLIQSTVSTSTSINQTNDTSILLQSLILGLSSLIMSENENETHVCGSNYEAVFVDDVSVHFADTVKILRDNNDDWLFVEVANDGRKGFVPKTIVHDLKDFVHHLKEQSETNQSSLFSFLESQFNKTV